MLLKLYFKNSLYKRFRRYILVLYRITPFFAFIMQNEIKYGSKGKSLALRLKSPVKTTKTYISD